MGSRSFASTLLATVSLTLAWLFPGQALATHVKCGDTITHDTRLDSDLIDCPTSGIVIGADDVTLDLDGHMVDGIASFAPIGIDNSAGHDGVVIENGAVQQFGSAVQLVDAANNRVRGITASDGGAVHGEGLKGSRIERNAVGAVSLWRSTDNRVVSNVLSQISTSESSDTYITDNHVSNKSFYEGIALVWSERSVVRRNTLHENAVAITVFGSHNSSIDHNSISVSSKGIKLEFDSTRNRIERNVVSDSSEAIQIVGEQSGSNQNRIENNFLFHNFRGISITRSHQNIVEGNLATRNDEDGILVRASSEGNSIESNRINRNGDDGIDVENAETTLGANRANRNGDLGIEAVVGTIDGGGNRAFGNGNPLECLNVACK